MVPDCKGHQCVVILSRRLTRILTESLRAYRPCQWARTQETCVIMMPVVGFVLFITFSPFCFLLVFCCCFCF